VTTLRQASKGECVFVGKTVTEASSSKTHPRVRLPLSHNHHHRIGVMNHFHCFQSSISSALINDDSLNPDTVMGFVSRGVTCHDASAVIFVRVAAFIDWIERIVWRDEESISVDAANTTAADDDTNFDTTAANIFEGEMTVVDNRDYGWIQTQLFRSSVYLTVQVEQ